VPAHALPAGDTHVAGDGAVGDRRAECLDERRLADAALAGDERDLARAGGGISQNVMEALEVRLPADQMRRGTPAGHRAVWLRRLVAFDGRDEAEAASMHRLDEARMAHVVVQGIPDLADRLRERRLRDGDPAPHGVEELFLGDEDARPLREIAEHTPGLGPQRDGGLSGAEESGVEVESVRRKRDLPTGRSRSRRTSG
jgi:hypothetical protein